VSAVQRVSGARLVLVVGLLVQALGSPIARAELEYHAMLRMPADLQGFGYPESVTADPHTGEVFVVDSLRNRIVIFDPSGVFRFEIPGGRRFTAPRDVAVDPEGYLVVLASRGGQDLLLELDFDGVLLRTVHLHGLPEEAEAPSLVSIAVCPTGERLFALDEANFRLWIADRDGVIKGSVELADLVTASQPTERMLGRVDVSGQTVLVVVSSESQVFLFDLDGKLQGTVGFHGTRQCSLGRPNAAALTIDGVLVVVDHQRMVLQRWDPVANRCLSEHFGFGDLPGFFYYPRDLALGPEGHLYVAQGFEGRVQVFLGLAPVAGAPRPPAD
jgi:sugar lactone lactonase YvrE